MLFQTCVTFSCQEQKQVFEEYPDHCYPHKKNVKDEKLGLSSINLSSLLKTSDSCLWETYQKSYYYILCIIIYIYCYYIKLFTYNIAHKPYIKYLMQ